MVIWVRTLHLTTLARRIQGTRFIGTLTDLVQKHQCVCPIKHFSVSKVCKRKVPLTVSRFCNYHGIANISLLRSDGPLLPNVKYHGIANIALLRSDGPLLPNVKYHGIANISLLRSDGPLLPNFKYHGIANISLVRSDGPLLPNVKYRGIANISLLRSDGSLLPKVKHTIFSNSLKRKVMFFSCSC